MIKPKNQIKTKEELQEYYEFHENKLFEKYSERGNIRALVNELMELRADCGEIAIKIKKVEDGEVGR